ncbi:hypothetical protein E2P81_ATG04278 [Venturia nashicola]|uniref:Uncharacterized protein n=1 Tax=Venturia nashicola TaxID=86259 RepID=A0A4Z1PI35_9PEZI|nr:hypothetical protein E6O75_ATG04381 [Venturia nashicola]TLD37466.1 hypothetical protein E2P81_ATG04278 [Venturia nashicola]
MTTAKQRAENLDMTSDIVEAVMDVILESDDSDPFQDPDQPARMCDDSCLPKSMAIMEQPTNPLSLARVDAVSSISTNVRTASIHDKKMPATTKLDGAAPHSDFSTFLRKFDRGFTTWRLG